MFARLSKFAVAGSAAAMAAACATPMQLSPKVHTDVTVEYQHGTSIAVSEKENSRIAVMIGNAQLNAEDRPQIVVVVENTGETPFNISTENIKSSRFGNMGVHVYSHAELVAEEKRKQGWKKFAAAMAVAGNAAQASQAGYSHTQGNFRADTYGGYGGRTRTYGTYSGTTYDSAKAYHAQQAARQENSRLISTLRSTNLARLQNLRQLNFQLTTVQPGEIYMGRVFLAKLGTKLHGPENVSKETVWLIVKAGDDLHYLPFSYSKL